MKGPFVLLIVPQDYDDGGVSIATHCCAAWSPPIGNNQRQRDSTKCLFWNDASTVDRKKVLSRLTLEGDMTVMI